MKTMITPRDMPPGPFVFSNSRRYWRPVGHRVDLMVLALPLCLLCVAALKEKGYEVMTSRVEGKGHVSMLLTRGGRATVMRNMMKFLSPLRRPQR